MLIGLDMFNKIFNAFEMLLLGAIAVAVGYGIGKAFPNSGWDEKKEIEWFLYIAYIWFIKQYLSILLNINNS